VFDPGSAATIDELVSSAALDAQPMADTVRALGEESPAVRAFLTYGLRFSSGACHTEKALEDIESYFRAVSERDGAAWMDNTTIVTAVTLMSESGPDWMTPLTVWDLVTFSRATTCFERIYHHRHPDVDDDVINARLGADVLKPVLLPVRAQAEDSPLPETWDGAHRFMCELWFDAFGWLKRLSDRAGTSTLDGQDLAALRLAWSRALGRDDLEVKDLVNWDDVRHRWTSPSNQLLREMAAATSVEDTFLFVDPSDKSPARFTKPGAPDFKREQLGVLLSDLNLRSFVNQRLADFFQLPYLCAAARVPFRKHLYDRAVAVQQRLTAVEVIDDRYAELAEGVKLRLPVFLALAVREAVSPEAVWDRLADLRQRAKSFRARRIELDAALARNDLQEVARVAKALHTDVDNVLEIAGQATVAAGAAIVEEIAKGDSIGVASGVAAVEAASGQLLSSSVADRVLWRLRRPHLLWMNDLIDQAKHITEALPDFARLWRIPENRTGVFASRFAGMAELQR
jgi:hypothetical protein